MSTGKRRLSSPLSTKGSAGEEPLAKRARSQSPLPLAGLPPHPHQSVSIANADLEERQSKARFLSTEAESQRSDRTESAPVSPTYQEKGKDNEVGRSSTNGKGKGKEVARSVSPDVLSLASPTKYDNGSQETLDELAKKLNPSKAPLEPLSSYTCPICFSPPVNATLTPCGHICCGECLFTAVRTTIQRAALMVGPRGEYNYNVARCPICRAQIPGWDWRGGGVVGLIVRTAIAL